MRAAPQGLPVHLFDWIVHGDHRGAVKAAAFDADVVDSGIGIVCEHGEPGDAVFGVGDAAPVFRHIGGMGAADADTGGGEIVDDTAAGDVVDLYVFQIHRLAGGIGDMAGQECAFLRHLSVAAAAPIGWLCSAFPIHPGCRDGLCPPSSRILRLPSRLSPPLMMSFPTGPNSE